MRRLLSLLVLLAFAPLAGAQEDAVGVFETEITKAKALGKPMAIVFYASDGGGDNDLFWEEIAGRKEFVVAFEDYTLVALDYPRDRELARSLPDYQAKSFARLEYSGIILPFFCLTDADGLELCWSEYQEGGVEPFVRRMKKLETQAQEAMRELRRIEKTLDSGDPWPAYLEAAQRYGSIEEGVSCVAGYDAIVRAGMEEDSENTHGVLLAGLRALTAQGMLEDTDLPAARLVDPENKEGVLEAAIHELSYSASDPESAKVYLAAMRELLAMKRVSDKELVGFAAYKAAQEAAMLGDVKSFEAMLEAATTLSEVHPDQQAYLRELAEYAAQIVESMPRFVEANADDEKAPQAMIDAARLLAQSPGVVYVEDPLFEMVQMALDASDRFDAKVRGECLRGVALAGWLDAEYHEAAVNELDPQNAWGAYEWLVYRWEDYVEDYDTAMAQVDRVLAFAELGKVHDQELVQSFVLSSAFHAAYLDRPEDADKLWKWAGELGEIDDETSAAFAEARGE